MQVTREDLYKLINELPEQEIPTVNKFIKFIINDYKELLETSEENIEAVFDKLIKKIGHCSKGGNSVADVKLERE